MGQAKEGRGRSRQRARVCRGGYVVRRLGTWEPGVYQAKEWERLQRGVGGPPVKNKNLPSQSQGLHFLHEVVGVPRCVAGTCVLGRQPRQWYKHCC